MLRRASRAYACRSCRTLDAANAMHRTRARSRSTGAVALRVAEPASLSRRAACPSAVGAPVVPREAACASHAPGPLVRWRAAHHREGSNKSKAQERVAREEEHIALVVLHTERSNVLPPRSCEYAAPAPHSCSGTAGVSLRLMPVAVSRACVLLAANVASPPQRRIMGMAASNPSIERTPYGMLRMPPVAAHVER
jgi:hypothetical protein